MQTFDEQLVQRIDEYIETLFVPADPVLDANIANAYAAGLPAINVTPNQGKLLYLLARIAGARRVLELESNDGLFGSGHELESAFTNLLVNGMKYTLAEGTVRMRWWSDTEGAYFSVIDSGIGIPAEHLPRLTERFYRVDAGRSRGQGGSGLGLAIVKHAVQRHGGWLDVQSTEGKGSTFTCHFPQERICRETVATAASA